MQKEFDLMDWYEMNKHQIVHNPNLKPSPMSEGEKAKIEFMKDLIDKYGLPKHIEERINKKHS